MQAYVELFNILFIENIEFQRKTLTTLRLSSCWNIRLDLSWQKAELRAYSAEYLH